MHVSSPTPLSALYLPFHLLSSYFRPLLMPYTPRTDFSHPLPPDPPSSLSRFSLFKLSLLFILTESDSLPPPPLSPFLLPGHHVRHTRDEVHLQRQGVRARVRAIRVSSGPPAPPWERLIENRRCARALECVRMTRRGPGPRARDRTCGVARSAARRAVRGRRDACGLGPRAPGPLAPRPSRAR
jgi:hypothetical protein